MALDLYTFVSPKGNIGIYDFAQENCEKKLYFRLPIEETFRLLLESIDIFVPMDFPPSLLGKRFFGLLERSNVGGVCWTKAQKLHLMRHNLPTFGW